MRDLAFCLIWLAITPFAIARVSVGVLLWIWTALIAPNEMLYGFAGGLPFNKIATATTVLAVIVGRDRKSLRLDANLILLGALLLLALVSSLHQLAGTDLTWELYDRLTKVSALILLISLVIHDRLRLHAAVLTVVLAMGFNGVDEGLKFIASGGSHHVLGLSNVGDNNSFATAILMIIPLIGYLYRQSARREVRIACGVGITLCLISVIATYSRGGFIGLLLLGSGFVVGGKNKTKAVVLVAIVGLILFALTPESFFSRVDTIQSADQDASFMGRVVAWKLSTLIALDHPLIGGGLHAVQNSNVWSSYVPRFDELSFIPTEPPDIMPHAAHSIYFEVLGDLGFTGLAIFLGLLLTALGSTRAVKRMARGKPELQWAADLAGALQISLIIYAVTGALLSMGYFEMFYILMTLTAMLRGIVRQACAGETESARVRARRARRLPPRAGAQDAPAPAFRLGRRLSPGGRPAASTHVR